MSQTFSQNKLNNNENEQPSSIYQIRTCSKDKNLGFLLNNLTEHESIIIKNNDDFILQGFPRNGTSNNPYRIENLNLTSEHLTVYD